MKIFIFSDSMQPPENHVAMMQIDCEVINTRLLHIHQDSIPAHLSQGMRAETSNASLQRNDSNEEQGIHHHQYELISSESTVCNFLFRAGGGGRLGDVSVFIALHSDHSNKTEMNRRKPGKSM